MLRRKAAKDQVGGDEVDEYKASLLDELRRFGTKVVCMIEYQLRRVEVCIGEMVASKVVKIRDLLWLRVHV